MELGFDLVDCLVTVEFLAGRGKIRLHQVNILFVVLHVDAWISDQEDSEVVEAFSNFFALCESRFRDLGAISLCSIGSLQVQLQVNHWHSLEFKLLSLGWLADVSSLLTSLSSNVGGFLGSIGRDGDGQFLLSATSEIGKACR